MKVLVCMVLAAIVYSTEGKVGNIYVYSETESLGVLKMPISAAVSPARIYSGLSQSVQLSCAVLWLRTSKLTMKPLLCSCLYQIHLVTSSKFYKTFISAWSGIRFRSNRAGNMQLNMCKYLFIFLLKILSLYVRFNFASVFVLYKKHFLTKLSFKTEYPLTIFTRLVSKV